jgi:hypothetical protein
MPGWLSAIRTRSRSQLALLLSSRQGATDAFSPVFTVRCPPPRLAVGGLLAFALSSLIRSQLYGLQPHDPFTYVSALSLLGGQAA